MSEKKKKTPKRMGRWLFLILWSLSYGFAWGASLWIGIFLTFYLPINSLPSQLVIIALIVCCFGLIPAILLTFPQKFLLKRGLGLNIRGWRRASIIAACIGTTGLVILAMIPIPADGGISIDLISILLIVSCWAIPFILTQTYLLRQHISLSWLWAISNIICLVGFTTLFLSANLQSVYWELAVLGVSQGLPIGLTLQYLRQKKKAEYQVAIT